MKSIGKLYVNCKLDMIVTSDKHMKMKKLNSGDLIDIINEPYRTFEQMEVEQDGLFYFGIDKNGTVFLCRIDGENV